MSIWKAKCILYRRHSRQEVDWQGQQLITTQNTEKTCTEEICVTGIGESTLIWILVCFFVLSSLVLCKYSKCIFLHAPLTFRKSVPWFKRRFLGCRRVLISSNCGFSIYALWTHLSSTAPLSVDCGLWCKSSLKFNMDYALFEVLEKVRNVFRVCPETILKPKIGYICPLFPFSYIFEKTPGSHFGALKRLWSHGLSFPGLYRDMIDLGWRRLYLHHSTPKQALLTSSSWYIRGGIYALPNVYIVGQKHI